MSKAINLIYYQIKPLIPRRLQIWLRSTLVNSRRYKYRKIWPILRTANGKPGNFTGWPKQKKFALVLTHDVDTAKGQKKCMQLMNLEKSLGFRSSFNFVPERYKVSKDILNQLHNNYFEVGVHGLNHDGKLFQSEKIFNKRALKINHYLDQWNAEGFRSPSMHHNLDWIHLLNIEYDASTFDTDPFEPQSDGCEKIFPFWYQNNYADKGYVELPYTLPQDFTVFILMQDFNMSIWKRKLDWIVNRGGMALLNAHPDYMSFSSKTRYDEYNVKLYLEFLEYIKNKYAEQYWHVLPKEVAKYWKDIIVIANRNKKNIQQV